MFPEKHLLIILLILQGDRIEVDFSYDKIVVQAKSAVADTPEFVEVSYTDREA